MQPFKNASRAKLVVAPDLALGLRFKGLAYSSHNADKKLLTRVPTIIY